MAKGTLGEFVEALIAKAEEIGFLELRDQIRQYSEEPSFQKGRDLDLGFQDIHNITFRVCDMIRALVNATTNPAMYEIKLRLGHTFVDTVPSIARKFDIHITPKTIKFPLSRAEARKNPFS